MKICLTLDDVLRNKTVQLGKIYKKYINPDIDLESLDFSTNNYEDIFETVTVDGDGWMLCGQHLLSLTIEE